MPGRSVGAMEGTAAAGYLQLYGGSMDVRLFQDQETMAAALKNGSIDCVIADSRTYEAMRDYTSQITSLEERFIDRDYCFAVSADNTELLQRLDNALDGLLRDGTIPSIISRWTDGEGQEQESGQPKAKGETSITVAVDPTFVPYAFYGEDGALEGLEIEIARAVCSAMGLESEFVEAEPDMLLYTVESGKVAIAIGRIVRDPENTAVSFSESYGHSEQLIVVRK